eukprot:jgi/Picre1/31737/NNA_007088.t1
MSTTSSAEKRADGLRQAMERMISVLDKNHLRHLQKESYMCMARCCDTQRRQQTCSTVVRSVKEKCRLPRRLSKTA